jgi:energy-coupling factor transporter ATP-binding protein EcfA2
MDNRPDLLDIGLAFWVGANPSTLGVLAAACQYTLRHSPEVRESLVASARQIHQKALPAIRLALPAASEPPTASEPPATTHTPTEHGPGLLGVLEGKPHLLIVGHTGGGKTTLLHALARQLAADNASVLVCDPDAIEGQYPGYRVVGAGDDYAAIGKALALATKEVTKRREQRKTGKREFPPIWVLVDEAHDVISEVEGAWAVLEDIIRRGRKLNVHAIIGTQDAQVKTLGLQGQSKLLDNLTRVDVRVRDGQRVAVIDSATYEMPDLPTPDDTVQKGAVQTSPDQLLAALLATSPDQPEAVDRNQSRPAQTSLADPSETARDQASRPLPDHQQIRHKLTELGSKNKVYNWLRSDYGVSSKGTAYEMINAALDTSEQSESTPDKGDGDSSDGGLAKYLGDRTW